MIKWILLTSLFPALAPACAAAQTSSGQQGPNGIPGTENSCASVLAEREFAELTGISLTQLSSDRRGKALVGKICSKELLDSYFLGRGWELSAERSMHPKDSRSMALRSNYSKTYCLPRHFLLRWLNRCKAGAVVYTFDDIILKISAAETN